MSESPVLLEFLPIGVRRPWGGRRLLDHLRPQLAVEAPVGESWEVADVGEQQQTYHSVVARGPEAGRTLRSLIEQSPRRILGLVESRLESPRLPLLFKFIDAAQDLSVQVHPDDDLAISLGLGPRGKSEAWIILEAVPGARIQIGLREGWDVERLVALVRAGEESSIALNQVAVKRGDIIRLPAGTIHSIGAGILLAEIQQSSDVTWRVDDGDRVGLDGKPRELHLDQVLLTTPPDGSPEIPIGRDPGASGWWRPIADGPFLLDELKGEFTGGWPADPQRFSILVVLAGQLRIEGSEAVLGEGDVRLVLPRRAEESDSGALQLESSAGSWILCASSPAGVR
ncbi:MAG: class I mannose-6-phosphate isomerase [Planctomycetota bacterium]|nr:class I mannose-6-phosphate isomerase [Planctomycetota bacterium]